MRHPECLTCECSFSSGCRAEKQILAAETARVAEPPREKHKNRPKGRPRGQGPIQLLRAYKAQLKAQENI